jgi:hypothetical protein
VSIGLFVPEAGDIFLRNISLFGGTTRRYIEKRDLCLYDYLSQKQAIFFSETSVYF